MTPTQQFTLTDGDSIGDAWGNPLPLYKVRAAQNVTMPAAPDGAHWHALETTYEEQGDLPARLILTAQPGHRKSFAPITLDRFARGARIWMRPSDTGQDALIEEESPIHDCAHCGVVGLTVGVTFTRDGQRYERKVCVDCWRAMLPLFEPKKSDVPLLLASPTE